MRLVLGLFKGIIIGGLIALGATQIGLSGGLLLYGAIGFVVGLLVGRPFWSHLLDRNSTVLVALLKGIVGFGVGAGVYAVVAHVWGAGFGMTLTGVGVPVEYHATVLGAAIGALYGTWVEFDDAPPAAKSATAGEAKG